MPAGAPPLPDPVGDRHRFTVLPPLALYVHLPWCVQKCPYCDFNSHALDGELPEATYIDALLRDLDHDLPPVATRTLTSIFIGGGTPSRFSGTAIARLLAGVRARIPLAPDIEITLEANPGTVDAKHFRGYRDAGVNRLSIGVQSFSDEQLRKLGRIHTAGQARSAVETARAAGFDNINLDLMFGLPGQTTADCLADLQQALALAPPHLSFYHLTIEPHTVFANQPPALPADDDLCAMQDQAQSCLTAHGYHQYEVSAWARGEARCRHNLNYWRFGDYLGIGAGAHGKLTGANTISRYWKVKHPATWLAHAGEPAAVGATNNLSVADTVFEFMLNQLRLRAGFTAADFSRATGLPAACARPGIDAAVQQGLLEQAGTRLRPSPLGWRFNNDLQACFLPTGS